MEAARAAGVYIPHLCYHPRLSPQGSCRLCHVKVNGRSQAACTTACAPNQQIDNQQPEQQAQRLALTQLLFVEGNHICPSCERSGDCQLQATAYYLNMTHNHFPQTFPVRNIDASHNQVLLDRDRCILCELCVRASQELDGKNVFAISGRGAASELVVNSPTGLLKDSHLDGQDHAVTVCPVGALVIKEDAFTHPPGERLYDNDSIDHVGHRHPHSTKEPDNVS